MLTKITTRKEQHMYDRMRKMSTNELPSPKSFIPLEPQRICNDENFMSLDFHYYNCYDCRILKIASAKRANESQTAKYEDHKTCMKTRW